MKHWTSPSTNDKAFDNPQVRMALYYHPRLAATHPRSGWLPTRKAPPVLQLGGLKLQINDQSRTVARVLPYAT